MLILSDVFNPKLFRTGEFLARALNADLIPPGSTVLDMGTGSGVGAIFAARWARCVVAIDINPAAVRCARINALLNCVEARVQVYEGDLFEPVRDESFDVVLFNPPFFHGTPHNDRERALWATGVEQRFASGLQAHLAREGHALVVLSSDGEHDAFLSTFRAHGWASDVVARQDLTSEILWAYRLRRKTNDHSV
jgi:release factor glutamine methyltransferase